MSKQESILKLLKAGRIIRVLDGRCGNGFVDQQALAELIRRGDVMVYKVKGMEFVRAKRQEAKA